MDQVLYYASTLIVFFFIFNILTWGLNIQFGYTGILNFTYITFFAAGAYFTGVANLGKPTAESHQLYILGLGWNFLPSLLLGGAVAGVLGLLVGLVALYRLRSDFLAIVTVGIGTIAFDLVSNFRPLFNGQDGISGLDFPFNSVLNLDPNTYTFFYIGFAGVVMLILWYVAHRIDVSPLGRTLRAIREDVDVAEAFGKNTYRFRMIAMVVGCVYAGIAGGLLIGFISSLNPSGWTTGETFIIWAALLLGGRGNNLGAVLGALLVPVVFNEATRFLPPISSNPELVPALRNVIVGALLIAVLFFRPQGLLPERRRRFYEVPTSVSPRSVEHVP